MPTHRAFSKPSAENLVRIITRYWVKRGHDVLVWSEPVETQVAGEDAEAVIWQVRSDLVNGLPKAEAERIAA